MSVKEIIKDISDQIQKNANVKTVFGEPYEKDEISIIPVARIDISGCTCGWEEMEMESEAEKKEGPESAPGSDIEMTVSTTPIGYIEINETCARFVDIQNANRLAVAKFALGGFIIFSISHLLMQFLRND